MYFARKHIIYPFALKFHFICDPLFSTIKIIENDLFVIIESYFLFSLSNHLLLLFCFSSSLHNFYFTCFLAYYHDPVFYLFFFNSSLYLYFQIACNILVMYVLYCTVLYCTVLYCTVLYCTVSYLG